MQWYYADNGKQVGPVSEADFQGLVASGVIQAQTLVWTTGMAGWAAYGSLTPAASASSVTSAPIGAEGGVCCECGKHFPQDELLSYEGSLVCAACKPVFFQRVQEGATVPGTMRFAGFWIRAAAKIIDGILVGVVNMVISMAFTFMAVRAVMASGSPGRMIGIQVVAWLIQMTIQGSYYVYFHGKYGATLGKMACKIKVVRADGTAITYGRAFGRFFGDMLSGIILCIGYIMAGTDEEKRALHDRLCDTRVIYKD